MGGLHLELYKSCKDDNDLKKILKR